MGRAKFAKGAKAKRKAELARGRRSEVGGQKGATRNIQRSTFNIQHPGGVFNFKLLVFSWDGAREDREGGEGKMESGK